MKHLSWLLIVIGLLTGIQCEDNSIGDGFEMTYFRDIEVSAGLSPLETHIYEFNLLTNYDNYLAQQGLTEADIETIVPKYIRLTNISGTQTYDILFRARLNIAKENGDLEYEVAYREPVPQDAGFDLDLIPTLAEVPDQLSGEQFKVKLKLNFAEIPNITFDTRLTMTFQAVRK